MLGTHTQVWSACGGPVLSEGVLWFKKVETPDDAKVPDGSYIPDIQWWSLTSAGDPWYLLVVGNSTSS